MKQIKTAVLIESLDPIFFNQADKQSCYLTAAENSLLGTLAKKNFSSSKIIFFKPALKTSTKGPLGILNQPNLLGQWQKNRISHFVIPHRFSQTYLPWAKKNCLQLIGPLAKQQKLENKVYFDKLLKKYQIPSPQTFNLKDLENQSRPKAWVVQQEESYGMFGTKFIKNFSALKKMATQKKSKSQLLIREYLPGVSLGVSIFRDRFGSYFFSALRRQCFVYQKGWPKYFLGIQWLPGNFFSPAVKKRITALLQQLVKVLAKEGFYGLANIDLIVNKGRPFILECNPRLSSATPQIFSIPGLTNHSKPWQFYLKTFYGSPNLKIKAGQLPLTRFKGCLLDIDLNKRSKIKRVLPPGVYLWQGHKLVFVSDLVKDFQKDKNSLFLFHGLDSQVKNLPACSTLATIVSHQPLFNLKTGSLNAKGFKIFNYYQKAILT